MASKAQLTGMTGTFLVAAQLSARGFIASTTSRSAAGADILVTDPECRVTYSIQVKTNSKKSTWWVLGNKEPPKGSKSHIYAFVNLRKGESGDVTADYYFAPSTVIRRIAEQGDGKNWKPYVVSRQRLNKYHDNWGLFENNR